MNKKGKFIVIEGMDGSGKTTLSNHLCKLLSDRRIPVAYTREPGGTTNAEAIRKIIFSDSGEEMPIQAQTLLFLASRAINISEHIKPKLEEGNVVLCDRFFHSTNVYQGHVQAPKLLEGIKKANMFSVSGVIPDLILYVRLPYEEAFRRKGSPDKSENWLDKEGLDFYSKVSKGYDKELLEQNEWNVRVLDGTLNEEELANKALEEVLKVVLT